MTKAMPLLAFVIALLAVPVLLANIDAGGDIAVSGRVEQAQPPRPATQTVNSVDVGTTASPSSDGVFAQRLLDTTNAQRRSYGLQPVAMDPKLQSIAVEWSNHLRSRAQLEHRDVRGKVGRGFLAPYARFGENLYKTNGDLVAADVHRAWMNSPAHRDNIADPTWNRIGFGVARQGDVTIVTQNFGSVP